MNPINVELELIFLENNLKTEPPINQAMKKTIPLTHQVTCSLLLKVPTPDLGDGGLGMNFSAENNRNIRTRKDI